MLPYLPAYSSHMIVYMYCVLLCWCVDPVLGSRTWCSCDIRGCWNQMARLDKSFRMAITRNLGKCRGTKSHTSTNHHSDSDSGKRQSHHRSSMEEMEMLPLLTSQHLVAFYCRTLWLVPRCYVLLICWCCFVLCCFRMVLMWMLFILVVQMKLLIMIVWLH